MSNELQAGAGERESSPIRPDPLFKDITRRAALANGLELLDIELPQLLRADLIVAVPAGRDLAGTLFEFLGQYSILEFKSENDTFDEAELDKNLARSLLFLAENKGVKYNQLLTVFVCAERPDGVIEYLKEEGIAIEADPEKEWLLKTEFGPLPIGIVVCRLLPLEKRYYEWLLFAPTSSLKWREFVKMLVRTGEKALLEQVKRLRLKEFRLMMINLAEELKGLSPEEQEQRKRDWAELIEAEINVLEELDPRMVSELVAKIKSIFTHFDKEILFVLFDTRFQRIAND